MTNEGNELFISRLINAPPEKVWQAWSRPEHLAKWWIPDPIECKVIKLDLHPGGGFETQMREGHGEFKPHVEACFLDVVPGQRLTWTTCLSEGWRPIEPWLALTAIITFAAEGKGTRYSAHVLHKNAAESTKNWVFTRDGAPPSISWRLLSRARSEHKGAIRTLASLESQQLEAR